MSNDKSHNCQIFHFDLYGTREEKYEYLNNHSLSNVDWKELEPEAPYNFFTPKDFSQKEEYEKGFKIDELFVYSVCGFVTSKDKVNVRNTEDEAKSLIHDCRNLTANEFRTKYNTGDDTRDWSVDRAMKDVQEHEAIIAPYLYRPFDTKFIVHTGTTNGLVAWPRGHSLDSLLHPQNLGLLVCKQQSTFDFQHIFIVKKAFVDKCTNSSQTKEATYVFPLYNVGFADPLFEKNDKLVLNYNPVVTKQIEISLGKHIEPLTLFDYIYAVLHSPSYRERYKEFLKIDFPRIPYPTDWEKFRDMVEKGEKLRKLHLMEDIPSKTGITFPVPGLLQIDCYRWQDNRVYINSEQYFEGVPESVWNFFIGGYQPAQKWLKDRKGLTLSFEDVKHYGNIIYVIQQTEQIMQEIADIL